MCDHTLPYMNICDDTVWFELIKQGKNQSKRELGFIGVKTKVENLCFYGVKR